MQSLPPGGTPRILQFSHFHYSRFRVHQSQFAIKLTWHGSGAIGQLSATHVRFSAKLASIRRHQDQNPHPRPVSPSLFCFRNTTIPTWTANIASNFANSAVCSTERNGRAEAPTWRFLTLSPALTLSSNDFRQLTAVKVNAGDLRLHQLMIGSRGAIEAPWQQNSPKGFLRVGGDERDGAQRP